MHGVKFGLAVTAGSKETERRLVCYPEPGKKGFRLFVSGLMPGSPVFLGGGCGVEERIVYFVQARQREHFCFNIRISSTVTVACVWTLMMQEQKSFQDEEPWIMSLAGAGILLQIE